MLHGSSGSPDCCGLQVGPFCWPQWPGVSLKGQAHTGQVHDASAGVVSTVPELKGPKQRGGNDSALCVAEKKCQALG